MKAAISFLCFFQHKKIKQGEKFTHFLYVNSDEEIITCIKHLSFSESDLETGPFFRVDKISKTTH